MPGSFQVVSMGGVPRTGAMPAVRSFRPSAPVYEYPYAISGVTRDSAGVALGTCVVVIYRTADDSVAGEVTSDASGNYRVDASSALTHYVVAYKVGSPDVFGTTVNTLVGT